MSGLWRAAGAWACTDFCVSRAGYATGRLNRLESTLTGKWATDGGAVMLLSSLALFGGWHLFLFDRGMELFALELFLFEVIVQQDDVDRGVEVATPELVYLILPE